MLKVSPQVAAVGLFNILLFALWLWSREGFTTHFRVDVAGSQYMAYVDGQPVLDTPLAGPSDGGVVFELRGLDALPTGAGAPELRWVRISDPQDGTVLLEDDFRQGLGRWGVLDPGWQGGRVPAQGGRIGTGPQPWADYRVEALVANPSTLEVYVRHQSDADTARVTFRVWNNPAVWASVEGSPLGFQLQRGSRPLLDGGQVLRGVVAVALRPYPWILGALVLSMTLLWGLARVPAVAVRWGRPAVAPRWLGALVLALLASVGLMYAQTTYVEQIPHVPDSAVYYFQAKMLAAGQLAVAAPSPLAPFDAFPNGLFVVNGRWVSQYPFGHPLLLALGHLVGQPWLIPPLVGGLCVFLTYWLGTLVYSPGLGLAAAALLAASPFFQMNGVDYMSHNTGALYLLVAMLGFVLLLTARTPRQRAGAGLVCGVALGLLFNTRPLTTVPVVAVLGAVLLGRAVRERRLWRPELAALAAGGGLMLAAYFGHNAYLTGDPLLNPYLLNPMLATQAVGLGGEHNLERALLNTYTHLTLLAQVLLAWPAGVALALLWLPFVLGTRNPWDYLFAATFLAIAGAWFFYRDTFIMYGPRFWYEATPLLMLLAARGVWIAGERAVGFARGRAAAGRRRPSAAELVPMPLLGAGLIGIVLVSVVLWWAPPSTSARVWPAVPENVRDLRGFNFTDAAILTAVQRERIRHAVVLVADTCNNEWYCYGSVFPQNDVALTGDVVYARDLGPESNLALRRRYPDRPFYRVDYHQRGRLGGVTLAPAAELPPPSSPVP